MEVAALVTSNRNMTIKLIVGVGWLLYGIGFGAVNSVDIFTLDTNMKPGY